MYNLLELNNFRGFKKLSLELKPITLIAGKNNTGKTSILDSILLFQDYADPNVFLKLLGIRGTLQSDTSARAIWDPLFYNMDTKNPIEIKLNNEFSLCLNINNGYAISNNTPGILDGKTSLSSISYALSCDFKRGNKRFSGNYLMGKESLGYSVLLHGRDNPIAQPNEEFIQYIGPRITLNDITLAEWFGQIELSQNEIDKKKLINILTILDEDIVDITTIATNRFVQLYFTNRQKIKLPIHTIGDGLKKILHIVLVLLAKPESILLLDEVENGLHYSLYPMFWEMLSELAIQQNCQIIATSHSYECISGALEGVKAAGQEDNFSYVRMDKGDKGIVPKVFCSEMLQRALVSDWEVR